MERGAVIMVGALAGGVAGQKLAEKQAKGSAPAALPVWAGALVGVIGTMLVFPKKGGVDGVVAQTNGNGRCRC
jgi:hypothetical protein